ILRRHIREDLHDLHGRHPPFDVMNPRHGDVALAFDVACPSRSDPGPSIRSRPAREERLAEYAGVTGKLHARGHGLPKLARIDIDVDQAIGFAKGGRISVGRELTEGRADSDDEVTGFFDISVAA